MTDFPVRSADLVLAVSVHPSPACSGQPVRYWFSVHNAGPDRAEAVMLTCRLPDALEQASFVPGPAESSRPWNGPLPLGPLEPGQSCQVCLTGLLAGDAHAPLVCAAALASPTADPTLSNNAVTLATPVRSA